MPKILLYRANRPALRFSPNESIGSRSTGGHLEISSINNKRTARVFIRFLSSFFEANLSSSSLPSIFWKYSKTFHQQPENIVRLFINNPKLLKDFFACNFVLATKHQLYSGNIQRLFTNNPKNFKDFSPTTRKYSKTSPPAKLSEPQIINYIPEIFKDFLGNQQQQPAAATRNSNQQQQSTAATSSSNQQQQPAAAINSSNQQQQSATATSSKNQQQQPAAAISNSNKQLPSY